MLFFFIDSDIECNEGYENSYCCSEVYTNLIMCLLLDFMQSCSSEYLNRISLACVVLFFSVWSLWCNLMAHLCYRWCAEFKIKKIIIRVYHSTVEPVIPGLYHVGLYTKVNIMTPLSKGLHAMEGLKSELHFEAGEMVPLRVRYHRWFNPDGVEVLICITGMVRRWCETTEWCRQLAKGLCPLV